MYIQLNSQVIYYEHMGSGDKTLLLLHGNGEDHSIFNELCEALEPHFDIYALDSRGQGLSATPNEYHYKDMAQDVLNLISALSLKDVAVFGFSDGGIVALMAEILSPGTFSHIITAGANTNPNTLTFHCRREIKREFKNSQNPLVKMMLDEPNITDSELRTIACPVLMFGGQKDLVAPKEFDHMNKVIEGSTLAILKGEDHGSYVIHSSVLAPEIRFFVLGEE